MASDKYNRFFFAGFKDHSDILDTYNEYFGIPTDVKSSKGNYDDIFLMILKRLLQYLIIRIIIRFYRIIIRFNYKNNYSNFQDRSI